MMYFVEHLPVRGQLIYFSYYLVSRVRTNGRSRLGWQVSTTASSVSCTAGPASVSCWHPACLTEAPAEVLRRPRGAAHCKTCHPV